MENEIQKQKSPVRRSIIQVAALGLDYIAVEKNFAKGPRRLLSADIYPYGMIKKDTSDTSFPRLKYGPIGHENMLSKMKDTAVYFQYKGVKR